MGYVIRYRTGNPYVGKLRWITPRQLKISAVLMILTVEIRAFWQEAAATLAEVFAADPVSLTERAVFAMARILAKGEGFHQALVIWCRVMLFGREV